MHDKDGDSLRCSDARRAGGAPATGRRAPFSSVVELLETDRGERLLRVAYSTDGVVRRGPVTLRARDLDRLRDALEKTPALAALLVGAA